MVMRDFFFVGERVFAHTPKQERGRKGERENPK